MIDPADQNYSTNVFRVKESTHPLLQKRSLFALGKRREMGDGAVYTIYAVKDKGDKSYKVDGKVGTYTVPKTLDEKYGDLTLKDVDADAFAEIGDSAIQSAEVANVPKLSPKKDGKLEVVEVPGRGDCFFQAVAYCLLADEDFLETVDFEPWESEADLKATKDERKEKNLMKTSDAWIARLRKRVSKRATVAMYLHAREMALQTLDRNRYVKIVKKAEENKKTDDLQAGDVYKDGGHWYFVHGNGKPNEQLDERPYPLIWASSKSEKEWKKEEKTDLEAKEKDADGQGEIAGHKLVLEKCNTFKEFKAFILTSDYWADERAVEVLAKELEINILVKDVGYGVNKTGVNADRKKTVILHRTGQHFNAMRKRGTTKYVFDTNGKIVKSLTEQGGGGQDSDEENAEEVPKAKAVNSEEKVEEVSKAKERTSEEKVEEDAEEVPAVTSEDNAEVAPAVTSEDNAEVAPAVTSEDNAEVAPAVTSEEENGDTNSAVETTEISEKETKNKGVPEAVSSGGRKRSKRIKNSTVKTKKVSVHTNVPF
jgi:hypothetical protein